jgi:hypothetical protein
MTDPLAELREALKAAAGADEHDTWVVLHRDSVDEVFIAFAAAHPGLIDLTLCGPQCPAWNNEDYDYPPLCDVSFDAAHTNQPCPVIARRTLTKSQVRRIADQQGDA